MLTLTRPDDMHVHFRSGSLLRAVLPFHAGVFARALVMPNRPWIGDAAALVAYRDEIRRAAEAAGFGAFEPLMTIALEDDTTPRTIEEARAAGAVAAKLYPIAHTAAGAAGATTGPESGGARGVAEPLSRRMDEVYRAMAGCGMVLCVHAECPPPHPRLLRERDYLFFIRDIIDSQPQLKIVVEHISDLVTATWVRAYCDRAGCTITAHHLADVVDDALDSPHHLCNPVPKRHDDREALWDLIRDGAPNAWFGSDSAPHPVSAKHCARPACGVFSAPGLLPRLAQMFESRGLLDRLEGFVSYKGADFYGLPRSEETVTLVRRKLMVPWEIWIPGRWGLEVPSYDGRVAVWRGGEKLAWSIDTAEPKE